MQLITDIEKNRKLIESSIKKYGHSPEHNYYNYKYFEGDGTKSMFFEDGGRGIASIRYSGTHEILVGVLALEKEKLDMLKKFLDHLLNNEKTKKVFVMLSEDHREKLIKENRYKIPKFCRTYYSPVYSVKKWDNEMRGKKWKKLRNLRNKLSSQHKVEFIPCKDLNKKDILRIYAEWRKRRKGTDKLWQPQFYENAIKNDFEGIENTRSLVVDGIPCTISGGWKIPNSNNYYSAIGLLNYRFPDLGEVAIINEFNLLQEKDYDNVNFGQSEKTLLDFKKKFYPEKIEREIFFSVSKR